MTATAPLAVPRQPGCRRDQPISDTRRRSQAPTTAPAPAGEDSRAAAQRLRRRLTAIAGVATHPQTDPMTDPETGCVNHARTSEKESDTGHLASTNRRVCAWLIV
jgi:hypothetical protein